MVSIEGLARVSEAEGGAAAEAALIRAALAGDRAAMERLLAPHRRPLVAFCHGLLGNAEDAEDAAQETFVRALSALASFRRESRFRSWLFRIAVNLCSSWRRSQRPTEPWTQDAEVWASGAASPDTLALNRLRLLEALSILPAHRRAALLLKLWEGYSSEEIAQVLGWNGTRVRNELYKARLALAEWHRREIEEGEER
jgi:RNA polymerase sigma-70 factor (ECF subfamily)